ncbi:hypothetical protein ACIO1C_29745 [Streptomyces sp. NPDC087420]|uniref:hypothetical protein n=1 Tax=Streptomyces sp. NPDC087420 TaxID=3365785 RepID=UPI00383709E6
MSHEISEESRTAFIDAFGDEVTARDTAPSMTCSEVDAMASMLTALGAPEVAKEWLLAHADDDPEEGDTHGI